MCLAILVSKIPLKEVYNRNMNSGTILIQYSIWQRSTSVTSKSSIFLCFANFSGLRHGISGKLLNPRDWNFARYRDKTKNQCLWRPVSCGLTRNGLCTLALSMKATMLRGRLEPRICIYVVKSPSNSITKQFNNSTPAKSRLEPRQELSLDGKVRGVFLRMPAAFSANRTMKDEDGVFLYAEKDFRLPVALTGAKDPVEKLSFTRSSSV